MYSKKKIKKRTETVIKVTRKEEREKKIEISKEEKRRLVKFKNIRKKTE